MGLNFFCGFCDFEKINTQNKAIHNSQFMISFPSPPPPPFGLWCRYTSGEESKDSKKKLLKSSLNNYTQSILDSTYYRECQLADAEFSDKASLEKVVGINQALSLPVQLCGSLERVVLLLGTELLECLYWRVGGLFYMYCHSFFEKEERRKNMDKEIFLKVKMDNIDVKK